ncbi:uncharacterized protein LOC142771429 [Rhipicephalus microplus]|uniref:uncharacterized protein LOC142771429 n=1 Tax=Rhipicephalus microplus TaxID=6941 RepID=UPI003F6CC50E
MSDVELWNRILTDNCMELREYRWCELTLMGYEWPEKKPGNKDALRASLLIHVLLRQHRCVTHIYMNFMHTVVERYVVWHAIKTGVKGLKRLEYNQSSVDAKCPVSSGECFNVLDTLIVRRNS